ncbi:MAG: hypothetical protein ACRD3M_10725 [Thermoanaerobaculia bacterium]
MKGGGLAERLIREGLPPSAADRVARSLDTALLRRREEDEVARELSAHFEDGLRNGRALEQLLHDFGDPALAGPLIGRGVRRRRGSGRQALRLAELFGLLVLAVYLVSFARLHAGSPEAARGGSSGAARRELLAAWSGAESSLEAAVSCGRARLSDARRAARDGDGSRAAEALLAAIETAREISGGLSPAHDLAALQLAAGAASAAAEQLRKRPEVFSRRDLSRIAASLGALQGGEIAWSPSKVQKAFRNLLSSMYTPGEDGRLTASGLRIFQAWKGKSDPGLAAIVLEPAYFLDPARRGEVARELDRLLALAAADRRDRAFDRERRLLEASSRRTLRYVSLQIPLEHLSSARDASRALERELARALDAALTAERRS